jgi:hypothetical protein
MQPIKDGDAVEVERCVSRLGQARWPAPARGCREILGDEDGIACE